MQIPLEEVEEDPCAASTKNAHGDGPKHGQQEISNRSEHLVDRGRTVIGLAIESLHKGLEGRDGNAVVKQRFAKDQDEYGIGLTQVETGEDTQNGHGIDR